MKLRNHEQVVAVIGGTVGVPARYFAVLAALEIAGAVGIRVRPVVAPLGVTAAACLTAYFIGALGAHLRVRDTKNLVMPLPPLMLSVAVLVLQILAA
jgi:hypothetical protein